MLARLLISASCLALAVGTLGGSSPTWPNDDSYAFAAFAVSLIWLIAAISDEKRHEDLAMSGLGALAIMRAAGYAIDLAHLEEPGLLAATGAWLIVIGLVIRPPHPPPPTSE